MKGFLRAVASAALLATVSFAAQAQNNQIPIIDGPTYVMTYVEVIPSAANQAIASLKDYRDATRKEEGAELVDLYEEEGQSHRFVVSEIWRNRGAVRAHGNSVASAALFEKLSGIELGPPDVRIHQAHAVTPPKEPRASDVIVISHADVAGGNTQNLIRAFVPLSEDSRKEEGMVRYEILDEVPAHANHFRLFEEWASMTAFEAHNRSPHVQTFRQTILPWLGTPYDQRLYRLVP